MPPLLIVVMIFVGIIVRNSYPNLVVRNSEDYVFYLGKVYSRSCGYGQGCGYKLEYLDKKKLRVTNWGFPAVGDVGDEVKVGYNVILKMYPYKWGDVYDVYYVDIKCFDISELQQPEGGWQENPLDSLKEQGLLDCDYFMQEN